VHTQRHQKPHLTPARITQLDSIGFSWDPFTEQWEQGFRALQNFKETHGHCRVAHRFSVNRFNLGTWVNSQRQKKDQLTKDRLNRLNSLGFDWDPFANKWDEGFEALQKFIKREGHTRVDREHLEDGLKLATWIRGQRANKSRLKPEQIKRLDELNFSWYPFAEKWEEAFAALNKFRSREGHTRVSRTHIEGDQRLGVWICRQRMYKAKLTPDQVSRLNSIGFSWDPLAERWEQNFESLKIFRKREGHSKVPITYTIDGLNLGNWVSDQRKKKAELTADKVKRLNDLGFIWKA
jgi:hypothetical protein